jgi:hypothetical protein
MSENVKTPNKPKAGTRLRNFVGSGGKMKDYKSSKGLEKAKGR